MYNWAGKKTKYKHDGRSIYQHPACLHPISLIAGVIRSVIQLSVPSSVIASGIMIKQQYKKQWLTQTFCIQSKSNSDQYNYSNIKLNDHEILHLIEKQSVIRSSMRQWRQLPVAFLCKILRPAPFHLMGICGYQH